MLTDSERMSSLVAAVAHLDPPFAVLDAAALASNADDLVRRAAGTPIRLASKSIRIRELLRWTLDRPGFDGLLGYTLPEALWLHDNGFDNIVVGYPTVSRPAIATLAADDRAAAAITLMVDDVRQLDLIDAAAGPARRTPVRVAIELDAGYRPVPGLHFGARRSPVHDRADAVRLAREVLRRKGFRLVGMMAYESQIAGVGDAGGGPGQAVVRAMQRASGRELAVRRARVVAAVRELADLEFVNGGGTGSVDRTAAEPSVTEIAAGSGLLAPGLFDRYRGFRPIPAAYFVLPVLRRPTRRIATVLGGGWIASGSPGMDRLPVVASPPGLRYLGREGAGEVQTPLRGRAAGRLAPGDRVWFRHAKAGELAEHVNEFHLVDDGAVGRVFPSYRGEGRAFL